MHETTFRVQIVLRRGLLDWIPLSPEAQHVGAMGNGGEQDPRGSKGEGVPGRGRRKGGKREKGGKRGKRGEGLYTAADCAPAQQQGRFLAGAWTVIPQGFFPWRRQAERR
eukprot:423415-Rhodomonas_salina.1